MGQYYKPAIITQDGRVLSIISHAFDSGAKLTEHSWIGNDFVNAAYSMIYKSPKRVAWIGDYACDDYEACGEAYTRAMPCDEFQKFYELLWGENRDGLLALHTRLSMRITARLKHAAFLRLKLIASV